MAIKIFSKTINSFSHVCKIIWGEFKYKILLFITHPIYHILEGLHLYQSFL